MMRSIPIGLDLLAGRPRDLRRRRDHTLDPALGELARERVPSRAGLIGDPDRSRKPGTERSRVRALAIHHKHLKLTRIAIKDRRDDLPRVHVQTDELAPRLAAASGGARLFASAR
jgi:hypothetical protein